MENNAMNPAVPPATLRQVRSWYGLPAEIAVEDELWHLVRVAGAPLNHPPLVNLVLRRGLPRQDRLYLSFQHEFGHLQTLPIALIHAALLLTLGNWRQGGILHTLKGLAMALVAHEAVWEMASETYVMVSAGPRYRSIYRRHPNPGGLLLFWATMGALAVRLTLALLRRGRSANLA